MESKNLKKRGSYTSAGNIYLMKKNLSFLAAGTILERLLSECVSYYSGYGIPYLIIKSAASKED